MNYKLFELLEEV